MKQTIIYQLSETDFKEALTSKLKDIQNDTLLARFSNVIVSVDTVAEMHAVHRDTVIKYAKKDSLQHQKDGNRYKFILADALQFDFNKLRRAS